MFGKKKKDEISKENSPSNEEELQENAVSNEENKENSIEKNEKPKEELTRREINGTILDENFFGLLYPYIVNEKVTDIKWNGRYLWIDDLEKGRNIAYNEDGTPVTLTKEFCERFCKLLSNMVNDNFNTSNPSLKAETPDLRIQAEHSSVSGDSLYAIAIRKTPSVCRLKSDEMVKSGYASEIVNALLPCIIRSHLSSLVIGDVGSGKTEAIKYLCQFIPEVDGVVTVEDTLELRLTTLYPEKDVYSMRVTDNFTAERAIRDALRLLTKWIIISEARGREIKMIMEGASTGCTALTSIHAKNTWEIPDRIMNMAGYDVAAGFENDIFTFFNCAIKIKREVSPKGIKRSIDQITFFSRQGKENFINNFVLNGKLLTDGKLSIIPPPILESFELLAAKPEGTYERKFLSMYKDYLEKEKKGS